MSFRGRPFRGYFPGRGRGQWGWPGGPMDGGGPAVSNEGGTEEEEEWEGEEEIGGQWDSSQTGSNSRGGGQGEWPRGVNFRGRGRGRGNFHSFQKNSGDAHYPPSLTPHDILSWLDFQPPFAIQRVMFHCQWLLHQYGFPGPVEETNNANEDEEEDGEEGPSGSWYSNIPPTQVGGELQNFSNRGRGKRPGFGYPCGGQQHWTPAGWVMKDNSHKITTKMKPLPEKEIIPPFSNTYPDAANDKEKLKMLINNFNMMSQELTKICTNFKIATLNKDDLSSYPSEQQDKLKTAINCVNNAEKTLEEYKEFLRTDKYSTWNTEQKAAYDEKIKSMIGETPQGIPYKKSKVSEDCEDEERNEETDG
ncbi:uncharacterized protein [Lepeophtheirus salmonis]|uniref:uncharacterized protein n=1 Tax=Lepeophtheirus salmonis TaxID=72036 RepID=UPI003AF36723